MADSAILKATRISSKTQKDIDDIYDGVIDAVMKKHKGTMEKIEKLRDEGRRGAARALFRSSGMLDDLAQAIASAGSRASELVQAQRESIVGVMRDDDGS